MKYGVSGLREVSSKGESLLRNWEREQGLEDSELRVMGVIAVFGNVISCVLR